MQSKKSQISMQDLANATGYSKNTVSLALRNSSRISEATRELIKAKAEELGYKINPLVSVLMQQRNAVDGQRVKLRVAYLTSFTASECRQNQSIIRLRKGMEATAERIGIEIEYLYSIGTRIKPARLIRTLDARNIEAVIFGYFSEPIVDWDERWNRFFQTAVTNRLPTWPVNRVENNQYQVAQILLDALKENGFQRIGFCEYRPVAFRTIPLYRAAYLTYQSNLLEPISIPIFISSQLSVERNAFMDWREKNQLDAVIVQNNNNASVIRKIDGRLPCFSLNLPSEKTSAPGVIQDYEQLGSMSLLNLVDDIRNGKRGPAEHPYVRILEGRLLNLGNFCK